MGARTGRGSAAVASRPAIGGGSACEALQDRQHEGGRLAGAGLGAGQQVAAGEDERDRLALDGRGFGVALCRDGAEQVGRQPERGEGQREAPDEALPLNAGPGQGEGWIGIGTVG